MVPTELGAYFSNMIPKGGDAKRALSQHRHSDGSITRGIAFFPRLCSTDNWSLLSDDATICIDRDRGVHYCEMTTVISSGCPILSCFGY